MTGGSGITSVGETACRVMKKGKDPTGLGRWVWLKLKGRNDKVVRVVSFCRPCDGSKQQSGSNGLLTSFRQQKRYFGEDVDPRERFVMDLTPEIETWMNDNEQLIVMGDLNTDVRADTVEEWRNLGLTEAISSRFTDPPPTFNQTKQLSRPIDGIWVSAGLDILKSGYLAFEEGCPSDHRLVWIDLDFEQIFGCPWNRMAVRPAQRLKVNQPKSVQRYNKAVVQSLKTYGLIERLESLAEYLNHCLVVTLY